jgi:hypothetical protein
MRHYSLEREAEVCRALAKEFAGSAEEPFLFKLASALDEVAAMETQQPSPSSINQPLQDQMSASAGPRWLTHSRH